MKKIKILLSSISLICLSSTAYAEAVDYVEKDFIVTAYYSPIPGQERYILGSLEADRILNGNGIAGADGTGVYYGMLAAPKEYSFGTSIYLEGLGVGEVHDRGGAIKDNRIDVWMGYGDEGLDRAMKWGKRAIKGKVYTSGALIPSNFSLESSILYDYSLGSLDGFFSKEVGLGDENGDVTELSKYLIFLGYLNGAERSLFDEEMKDALIKFQLNHGVIEHRDAFGSGHFGPITMRVMNEIVKEVSFNQDIENRLYPGSSHTDEVIILQKKLAFLGYFNGDATGIYGNQTVDAVFDFQIDTGIVTSASSSGAGAVGPSTLEKLNSVSVMRDIVQLDEKAPYTFSKIPSVGDKGKSVFELKQKLQSLGYLLTGPVDSFFDEATRKAVLKFQEEKFKDSELDANEENIVNALNSEQEDYIVLDQKHIYSINKNLYYGNRDMDVIKLQKKLEILGYAEFDEYTDLFNTKTRESVIEFQVDQKLVADESSLGAGHFGPKTRAKFNELYIGI